MSDSAPSPSALTFLWLAIWTGICVSGLYVAQPLLHLLGLDFQVSDNHVSLVSTFTQMGYGIALFLLVPLGDFFDKKKLILLKLVLLAGTILCCAFAKSFSLLLISSLALGIFASTTQDFIPVAADLAPPNKRGQYIGYVVTGLTTGILLCRTLSGWIAQGFGWRGVFIALFAATFFTLVTCYFFFPKLEAVARRGSVFSIYRSMIALWQEHQALRVAVIRHALMGMAFSAFWTNLSFFLSKAPYFWSASRIGMMGLAGALGALSTSFVGRIADKRGPLFGIQFATLLAFFSFLAMFVFKGQAMVIILGTVLFDLAVQTSLVSHQSIIYGIDETARGRINGLFISGLFVGFSLGSFISANLWALAGWFGVMSFCCACAAAAFSLTLTQRKYGGCRSRYPSIDQENSARSPSI
ncbi:MAG: MFS transporter [Oligoflexia bacterium]|nr:MFS transporter [Oligoflexia bacterium]